MTSERMSELVHIFEGKRGICVLQAGRHRLRTCRLDPKSIASRATRESLKQKDWTFLWDTGVNQGSDWGSLRPNKMAEGAVAVSCPFGYACVWHCRHRFDDSSAQGITHHAWPSRTFHATELEAWWAWEELSDDDNGHLRSESAQRKAIAHDWLKQEWERTVLAHQEKKMNAILTRLPTG